MYLCPAPTIKPHLHMPACTNLPPSPIPECPASERKHKSSLVLNAFNSPPPSWQTCTCPAAGSPSLPPGSPPGSPETGRSLCFGKLWNSQRVRAVPRRWCLACRRDRFPWKKKQSGVTMSTLRHGGPAMQTVSEDSAPPWWQLQSSWLCAQTRPFGGSLAQERGEEIVTCAQYFLLGQLFTGSLGFAPGKPGLCWREGNRRKSERQVFQNQ